jgi:hypothetical protein
MSDSPLDDAMERMRQERRFEPVGELLMSGYQPSPEEWLEIFAIPVNGGPAPKRETGETLQRKRAIIAYYKKLRTEDGIISREVRIQTTADAFDVHPSLVRYLVTSGDPRLRSGDNSDESLEEVD